MSQKNANQQPLDVDAALSQSEAFIIRYKKQFTTAVIAALVVIGVGFGLYHLQQTRENKAQTQLALGQDYFTQGDFEKALNGDGKDFPGYIKIADNNAFTDAANLAHAYAGICYARLGKTAEAIKQLESFSPQGDASVTPAILCTLANCYATNKQVDKAIETFKTAADKADNAAFSPMCLIEAGRLLETQGKKEEANKLYTRVKEEYAASMQGQPQMQGGRFAAPEIDKYIERTK